MHERAAATTAIIATKTDTSTFTDAVLNLLYNLHCDLEADSGDSSQHVFFRHSASAKKTTKERLRITGSTSISGTRNLFGKYMMKLSVLEEHELIALIYTMAISGVVLYTPAF